MATHTSTFAWRIPWTEEPSRLQSMGLQRVGHDGATSLSLRAELYPARLYTGFFRQEYWSGWLFPPPVGEGLPDPGIEPASNERGASQV